MPDNNSGLLQGVLGALPAVSAVANPIIGGMQNRAARRFSERMYNRQRTDALTDWQQQNEYNSPEQQMLRLKKAGLNPNLVYGNGVVGNSAGQPRAAGSPSWSPKPLEFDGGSVLSAYYNTQLQKAQIELLRTNNEVRQRDRDIKDAAIVGQLVKNSQLKLKYGIDTELSGTYIDLAKQRLRNLEQNTNLSAQRELGVSIDNATKQLVQPAVVDYYRLKVQKGEMDVRRASEQILTIAAQRSKVAPEVQRIHAAISDIKAGVSLKDVQRRLAEFDLSTGRSLPGVLGNILRGLLK